MKNHTKYFVVQLCLILLCIGTSCSDNRKATYLDKDQFAEESIYQLNKPLLSSHKIIDYHELELPSAIGEWKPSIVRPWDKNNLLIVLYDPDPRIEFSTREYGILNFKSNHYEKLFSVPPEHSVGIRDINHTNIVYQLIDSSYRYSLHVLDLQTKEDIEIHKFPEEYVYSSVNMDNNIVLFDDGVYYDEVEVENGEVTGVNLLQFDLKTREKKLFRENAQNPIIHNNEILFIIRNDTDGLHWLTSSDSTVQIKLSEGISELVSVNNTLFSRNNKFTDDTTRTTIWSVNNMTSDEELFTASNIVDDLKGNSKVIGWSNFRSEKPILYLRDSEEFVLFEDFKAGYHGYLFHDDYGVLIHSTVTESTTSAEPDQWETKYYIFTVIR